MNKEKKRDNMEFLRQLHIFNGQVQGVGFRPFIYNTAKKLKLSGYVKNSSEGVVVEVQGSRENLILFSKAMQKLPPLAQIKDHEVKPIALIPNEESFKILASSKGGAHSVLISPDIATCDDCLSELFNPNNRRYLYPFINCTNCGPRYSITHTMPYDRSTTSMACFHLCKDCSEEYYNPENRRFHAQPNACPLCGPKVWFTKKGEASDYGSSIFKSLAAIDALLDFLLDDGIAAIKGLGGFHLSCLATSSKALQRLRKAKKRPHKALALMPASLAEALSIAQLTSEEITLLTSPERPIVLCQKTKTILPKIIAPDSSKLGLMLPYTPLHQILLARLKERIDLQNMDIPAVLVMSSANKKGQPICLGNREAVENLGFVAEAFLFHNRDILIRVDDSVLKPIAEHAPIYLRRGRGYAPLPFKIPNRSQDKEKKALKNAAQFPSILCVGAELKNTLALSKGKYAFVSQHIGDMQNVETTIFHDEIRQHLEKALDLKPEYIVRDLHPDYLSTQIAENMGLPVLKLQHHAAHAFAVLGENEFTDKALVFALDGTGYGSDGTLWGGEAIIADMESGDFFRAGTFKSLPLPGGEAAIKEPWRIAHAFLALKEDPEKALKYSDDPKLCHYEKTPKNSLFYKTPWLSKYRNFARQIPIMLEKNLNTPLSSSCGRLFDAASALLGICLSTSYEGQAAIKLEEYALAFPRRALPSYFEPLPCPVLEENGLFVLDSHSLLISLNEQRLLAYNRSFLTANETQSTGNRAQLAENKTLLALAFHESLISALTRMAKLICRKYKLSHIGLSGGCFNNAILIKGLHHALRNEDLIPLTHKELPPGDGCISYGQAVWANLKLSSQDFDL